MSRKSTQSRSSHDNDVAVNPAPPPNLAELASALKNRGVPSVTVVEWWPPSRKCAWHHRAVGRAWIVSDVVDTASGASRPGTAIGSDGHLHGFVWRTQLNRRRGLLLRWRRSPKQVPASKLFPAGAVQYVPVVKWESDDDLVEFCRRSGIDLSGPMIEA